VIIGVAFTPFLWFGLQAQKPPLIMNGFWTLVLVVVLALAAVGCGRLLWKKTQFD
jgi:uncharacterized membrane protein